VNTFFVLRDDGCFDVQCIQLNELDDVPRASIQRVRKIEDQALEL
jgi:hypothetical protein